MLDQRDAGHRALSKHRFGGDNSYGITGEGYSGPTDALGLGKGTSTSFERRGGAFTTKNLTQGAVVGLSAQSRGTLVNWDGGSSTPGFNQ